MEFVEGTAYTLGFDASASRAVTATLQAGGNWPDVFAADLALTVESQRFDFDVTPAFTAESGGINFQLGGKGEPFTFCLDNVSMTSATELLPQTTFEAGKGVWGVYGVTAETQKDDALCLSVPAGGDPWSAGMTFNGVPIEQDASYTLRFTASATPATNGVRVIVGGGGGPAACSRHSPT